MRPLLSLLSLAVLPAGVLRSAAQPATPPNFVVIMAEAQGWAQTSVQMDDQVSASRHRSFRTPAVERLAREGMRFTFGYALSPRCTPSRAALFTGRNPAELQMTYVGIGRSAEVARTRLLPPEPVLELPGEALTVAEVLRARGYATAHFGKWHVGRADPARHGFDASDGPTNNGGPDQVASPNPKQAIGMTDRGIAFLTNAARAGRPFYVQLSHYPDQERKEGRDDRGDQRSAEEVDRQLARLLEALDALGLSGNTYLAYTADHGGQGRTGNAPLSGGKGSVLEGGLRVPFLLRGPGIAPAVCSRVPVTACDLLPTFAELAGASCPPGVDGGSLVTVLRDPAGRGRVVRPAEELLFHFPHYDLGNGGPATALLLGTHKLIRSYETGAIRLFELESDPGEARDLAAADPARTRDLLARMDARLRALGARMALPNPHHDPSAAPADEARRGTQRGPGQRREKS
jgi:arylsulfatase A-like enzyme